MTILKEPQYIILQKCKLSAKRIETVLTYLHSNLAKICFLVQYINTNGRKILPPLVELDRCYNVLAFLGNR